MDYNISKLPEISKVWWLPAYATGQASCNTGVGGELRKEVDMLLRNRGRRLVRGWVRWRGRARGECRQADELHGRILVSDAPVQHPNPHPLPFPLLLPSSEPLYTF